MKKNWFIVILSALALLFDILFHCIVIKFHLIVFLDTIFVVSLTIYAGLVPGLIVSAVHNPIITLLFCTLTKTQVSYYDFMYSICGMLIVTVTWAFSHNKKEFLFSRTVTVLYLFVIALCSSFVSCISASLLDTFVRPFFNQTLQLSVVDDFYSVFQHFNFGIFFSYLLPRIPITVLDRLICTFAGYGVYKLIKLIEPYILHSSSTIQEG